MKRYLLYTIVSVIFGTTIYVTASSQTVDNPVIRDYVYHDSSLIDGKDGYFYSFVSSVVPRDTSDFKFYYAAEFKSSEILAVSAISVYVPDHLLEHESAGLDIPLRLATASGTVFYSDYKIFVYRLF